MRAVLRRGSVADEVDPTILVGQLSIDPRSREVTLDGRTVSLTRKEFDLLLALASALGDLVVGRRAGALESLERQLPMVAGRGACTHPDGAVRFIASAVRCFRAEVVDDQGIPRALERHARRVTLACPALALRIETAREACGFLGLHDLWFSDPCE